MNLSTQMVIMIWKVVGAVVGIPALSALGVYLLARFTKTFDAYGEERGRLLAQSHSLELLIEQQKALTATTEGIKAQLSDEAWGKQQRWLKRLETYVAVIEALQKYQQASVLVEVHRKTQQDHRDADVDVRLDLGKQFGEAMAKYNEATNQWTHTYSLAQLCCANDAVRIIRSFTFPAFTLENIDAKMPVARNLAAKISAQFVAAARKDLGYEPLPTVAIMPVKNSGMEPSK